MDIETESSHSVEETDQLVRSTKRMLGDDPNQDTQMMESSHNVISYKDTLLNAQEL